MEVKSKIWEVVALIFKSLSPQLSKPQNAVTADLSAPPPLGKLLGVGDRSNSLRRRRLPPPPLAAVARAPAATSLGGSCDRRPSSRPILQALVAGASGGNTLHSLHTFHAFSSAV